MHGDPAAVSAGGGSRASRVGDSAAAFPGTRWAMQGAGWELRGSEPPPGLSTRTPLSRGHQQRRCHHCCAQGGPKHRCECLGGTALSPGPAGASALTWSVVSKEAGLWMSDEWWGVGDGTGKRGDGVWAHSIAMAAYTLRRRRTAVCPGGGGAVQSSGGPHVQSPARSQAARASQRLKRASGTANHCAFAAHPHGTARLVVGSRNDQQ